MNQTSKKLNGKLVIALGRSYRLIHQRSEVLFNKYHITFGQFEVLEALYHKGSLIVKEIIEKVLSNSGNMTVVIKNLEREGLIIREVNKDDQRSYIISLSNKGRELIKEVFPQHMLLLDESLKDLTKKEKEEVIEILKKLKS